jgi:hypothetical protein
MNHKEFHKVLKHEPFRPFRIHLSNGRTHDVHHPELAIVFRTYVILATPSSELIGIAEDYSTITLMHVNELEILPVPSAGANGPSQ